MVVEILILLSCTWSISMRKFVEYEEIQKDQAPLAIVIPERGKPEIVALDPEDKSFRFQNLRFVLMRDKTSYEAQPALDNLLLSTYLETKGHSSKKSMASAVRTFGTNELNIPTPEFSELFKEQVAAPFFVFQVFTVGLWCMDEYWQFSVLTLFMLVIFEVTVTKRRIANLSVLRDMRSEPYVVYLLHPSLTSNTNCLMEYHSNAYSNTDARTQVRCVRVSMQSLEIRVFSRSRTW